MCGICGAVGFEDGPALVRQMGTAMIHRGPDSDGLVDDDAVCLGVRRLKIIDLETGDQPIFNEDRNIAIVFNGEIYNYKELFQELQARGHRFNTRSDTETIVHAYEEWGVDCPNHLRGMFAFAIYDKRPKAVASGRGEKPLNCRLFLARDRMGIKPLYYWYNSKMFLFASEVRALLASGRIPKRLSAAGLYTYLAFGSVQEPITMVENVASLPAASWMQVDITSEGTVVKQEEYWHPPKDGNTDPPIEQVRSWLSEAVRSHLVSEVPLGAFLSGGLDSGAIVALASEAQEQPVRTFTLAFDDWPEDERRQADYTVRRWKTDHQLRLVTSTEVLFDLSQAIASMDQPTVDGINTWYVAREARRDGLTVSLSGVGGDELFAGYPSFKQCPNLEKLIALSRVIPSSAVYEDVLALLPGRMDARRKLGAWLGRQTPFNHAYFAVRGLFTTNHVRQIIQPQLFNSLMRESEGYISWEQFVRTQICLGENYDPIGEVSWLELSQYMRSTLLRDTDMMSMAHSLEVRVPFLDHSLVENVLPIRGEHKIGRQQTKPLLVKSLHGMLPSEILGKPKQTFTFPFEDWLRDGLARQVGEYLLNQSGSLSTWGNPQAIARVWQDFENKRTNWSRPWALYILDEWIQHNL